MLETGQIVVIILISFVIRPPVFFGSGKMIAHGVDLCRALNVLIVCCALLRRMPRFPPFRGVRLELTRATPDFVSSPVAGGITALSCDDRAYDLVHFAFFARKTAYFV
jgi:hypothetical protein